MHAIYICNLFCEFAKCKKKIYLVLSMFFFTTLVYTEPLHHSSMKQKLFQNYSTKVLTPLMFYNPASVHYDHCIGNRRGVIYPQHRRFLHKRGRVRDYNRSLFAKTVVPRQITVLPSPIYLILSDFSPVVLFHQRALILEKVRWKSPRYLCATTNNVKIVS